MCVKTYNIFLSDVKYFLKVVANDADFIFLGDFFYFFFVLKYTIQHCFICRPSDFNVPTDAGIESRTVATGALAVRRSNHEAKQGQL
jgi:hypothetical protein